MQEARVEVIGTSGCGKCRILKMWLESKEIPYKYRNISYDNEAVEFLRERDLKSLPQVTIDGELVEFKEYNDILEYL